MSITTGCVWVASALTISHTCCRDVVNLAGLETDDQLVTLALDHCDTTSELLLFTPQVSERYRMGEFHSRHLSWSVAVTDDGLFSATVRQRIHLWTRDDNHRLTLNLHETVQWLVSDWHLRLNGQGTTLEWLYNIVQLHNKTQEHDQLFLGITSPTKQNANVKHHKNQMNKRDVTWAYKSKIPQYVSK